MFIKLESFFKTFRYFNFPPTCQIYPNNQKKETFENSKESS